MKSIKMRLSPLSLAMIAAFATNAMAEEQQTELAPIVVTASGTVQELRDAPASISVISQTQLKKTSCQSFRKCTPRYSRGKCKWQ